MTDIVSADWLADRLGEVAIVDVREGWEYDGIGHLPGAVNVPFDSFRAPEHAAEEDSEDEQSEPSEASGETASDSQGMLPGEDVFADLMREAGIEAGDDVVAYDDTHGVFAARFLVTAELYGHDPAKLHLLDGDFSAWQRGHETTGEVPDPEPSDYVVDPPGETPLVGADAVADATEREGEDSEPSERASGDAASSAVIVDTREQWEYEEGHIPGAVRLDWRELVDDDTRGLVPEAEARELLESRGITPDARIVLYCNTARRISHTYVVLRHLGYENLAFYEGSLTEWENQGRPLETGAT